MDGFRRGKPHQLFDVRSIDKCRVCMFSLM